MNLLEISEALKGVPISFLEKEANPATSSGLYPSFAVVTELSKRINEKEKFAMAEAQMPTQTITEQIREKAAAPMPTTTTMAMGQMQPDMNTGIRSVGAGGGMVGMFPSEPRGQETMGMPAAVRMYEGGRINMENGMSVGDALVNRINQLKVEITNTNNPIAKNALTEQLVQLQNQLGTDTVTPSEQTSITTPDPKTGLNYVNDGEAIGVAMADNMIPPPPAPAPAPDAPAADDAADKNSLDGYKVLTSSELRKRLQENPEFMPGTKGLIKELKDKESNIKDFSSDITVPEPITIENTLKNIQNNRSNTAIDKVYARLDEEKDSIEKDRRLAIPKTIMQFGLALATANDGSFLRAVASAGKQASATYSALQNDLRKSDKLLNQARDDFDLAQAARDDGDMKEARRIVERRTDRIAAAEESKANAAYRVNTLLQKNDELLLTVQTSLETGLDKAVESEVTAQKADRLAAAAAELKRTFDNDTARRTWITGSLDKIRTAIGSLTKGTTDPYGMGSGQLTEEAKKQLNRLRADRELYETLQTQYFPEIAPAPAQ